MRSFLSLAIVLSVSVFARAAEPFEIKEGDRVLFLGDTLLEREGTYGYLETRMHEQFPDRHFTVRNLSWSGETPRGWSRASFDGPDKGTERLKEDIAKVRPTVVFLGFGMAASLQEMTDRSADITLNPDPKRYGEEPMSAARFKKELGELMDAIKASYEVGGMSDEKKAPAAAGAPPHTSSLIPHNSLRFVLLSPIRHEDLRAVRPGLPDPAPHNALLEQYTKAIEELAKERSARFVDIFHAWEKVPRKQMTPADSAALAGAVGDLSPNGIHLSELGYSAFADDAGTLLGWPRHIPSDRTAFDAWKENHKRFSRAVLPAVVRKNELFFHQFRPANSTYLFGFRKHEQGQNAKEMPMFDPLIAAAEAEIDRLKGSARASRAGSGAPPEQASPDVAIPRNASKTEPASKDREGGAPSPTREARALPGPIAGTPPPLPDFTVADGYQIELWAQNPFLEKPTQMNWDPQGRLWVCSSSLYPQIEPGQAANDKILILSDTDGDGKADKSEVFADGLLIPTGVVPDLVMRNAEVGMRNDGKPRADASADSALRIPHSAFACYVGQSTELLHFTDTDGDGRADQKRIVFSGFGTEDTHHIIHTLHWGPDGRLFFHQSVYIHSHLETPWGMVRLNSGGVFAYDPRTERVEVFAKGLWNTWGQAEDDWGQTFLTDGAGRDGISWAFPGAVFAPFEGSRRQMPSVSPGSYPKFCGLEIVKSPHFPADWQGNMVTCDFRAHRIVRFQIEDLGGTRSRASQTLPASQTPAPGSPTSGNAQERVPPRSGYATTEQPDLIRTTDLSFRPIDVRLGPDGALYVADWSNPVINHGEVDFRDPRRDKHLGRIWRISRKDAKPLSWEPLLGKKNEELLDKLLSKSAWEKEQARRVLTGRMTERQMEFEQSVPAWAGWNQFRGVVPAETRQNLEGMWLAQSVGVRNRSIGVAMQLMTNAATPVAGAYPHGVQAAAARILAPLPGDPATPSQIETAAIADNPRVRLEAMRALARIPTARSAELVLDAAVGARDSEGTGSTRAPRVGSGAPAGTSSPAGAAAVQNGAARAGSESPAGAPATTREARVLPSQNASGALTTSLADDPWYDFAAWQSINDLAKPWTDALASGAYKTEGREAQLAYGLKAIDPALAGAAFSKLFAAGKVPLDGPWIDLIGEVGGPVELQRLLDGLLAGYVGDCCETDETRAIDTRLALTGPAAEKAIVALQTAARVRNAKPAAHSHLVTALFQTRGEIGLGAIRLAGMWKAPDAVAKIGELLDSRETKPPLRRAAVDGLRAAGGPAALGFLRVLTRAEETADTRSSALVAAVQVKLDAGLVLAAEVLPTFTDEAVLLGTWRGLLGVKGAPDAFALKFGKQEVAKSLPPPVLAAAVRAAREAGKPGAKLLAALAPFAGLRANADVSKDYVGLAAQTKQNGDPAKGELVYRRATSACVTCHAIGGAGGKVGPDMTSIGASAPLDYIIESTLDPAAKVKEGYNAVTLTLLDGEQVTGIQSRETATEVFLRDAAGTEKGVPKAQIKSKADIGSMMPPGLTAIMKPREALDMYAFLSELGKPGPYDASKGSVARVWRMYPGTAAGEVVSATYDPAKNPGFAGYTLVDGRFVKDLLTEATMIAAGGSDTVLLATQFQSSGKTRLKLTGASKAWLDGNALVLGGEVAPELANGTHTLVVKIGVKELPEVLRAESPDARFLGN